MGKYNINILCYADDTLLIAENEDDLQRLLYEFSKICKNFNLKISTQKTKAMTIAKNPIRCKLVVDNQIIEQVLEIKYLGITLTSSGQTEKEIKEQIIKGNRIAGCLNYSIWYNKHLKQDSKVRIYKSIIRPILTYAAETRSETIRTQQQLEVAEMRVLRKITNHTLLDKERNRNIREVCKIKPITEWVADRRKEWNDHIERMEEKRIVRIARDERPRGRREVGRPRRRWKDSL